MLLFSFVSKIKHLILSFLILLIGSAFEGGGKGSLFFNIKYDVKHTVNKLLTYNE